MAHPHANVREREQHHAEEHVRKAGYKAGGAVHPDAAEDRKQIAAAVHKHERHDHKGEALTPLRSGGKIGGHEAKARADRYARGGHVKKGGPDRINIVIATGGGEPERQMAFREGAQVGSKMGAMAAARPPMAGPGGPPMPPPRPPVGPPPGAPPMGAPLGAGVVPPRPPGMMKKGGRVNTEGGGGGAEGRLEKAGMTDAIHVRAHTRRRAGGRA